MVDQDLFRDSTYERAIYLAPSLTWNLSMATSATLLFERRKSDKAYDLFLASLSVVNLRAVQIGKVVKIVPVTLVVAA